jgi:hypothetical protein
VDLSIWGVLETHLPAVWGTGGRRDEEELASIRKRKMRILGLDRSWLSKVDLQALAHDSLPIPDGSHSDRSFCVVERDDDTTEGFEGRKGVDRCRVCYQVADGLQVLGQEDVGVVEVGEEEGVGGRCRL